MKGDEKHRLDQNELQRLVTTAKEKSKPFMDQYGNTLLLAVSATILVVAICVYIFRDQASEQAKGWDPLGTSLLTTGASSEKLATVGEQFPDTIPGLVAKVQAAQQRINRGVQFSFSQTASARDELKAARELLEEALESKEPALPPVINAQAMFALAECLESTWNGEPAGQDSPITAYNNLIETYEKSLDKYPEISPYVDIAKRRRDRLKSSESQAFYAWFREQNLSPTKVAEMRAKVDAANLPPTSPHNTGLPAGHPAIEPPTAFDKWETPGSILNMILPAPEFESSPFPDGDVPDEGERKVKPIPDLDGTDNSTKPDATTPDSTTPDSTTPPEKEKPPVKPIPDGPASSDAPKADDADKADANDPTPESAKPSSEDKPETP